MRLALLIGIFSIISFAHTITHEREQKKQYLKKKSNLEVKKSSKKNKKSAIIYNLNGGRFGDNLFSYCKTKWLSYKYDIPLLYKPFQYSNQLKLHKKEKLYNKKSPKKFEQILYVSYSRFKNLVSHAGILYIKKWYCPVHPDWKDEKFMQELKKLVKPAVNLSLISLPKDRISVAAHVRRGGGYRTDGQRIIDDQPLRFAPNKFYIDQIKRLTAMFKGKKLYVHIFTDDRNPRKIASAFKKGVNRNTIIYGFRKRGNNHSCHVLEDFFSMMKFDCLIRPNSHYSLFVERLGSNKVIISPVHASGNKRNSVIDIIRIRQLTDDGWRVEKVVV